MLNNLYEKNICDMTPQDFPTGLGEVDFFAWMFVACVAAWVRHAADLKEGVIRYEDISIMRIAT